MNRHHDCSKAYKEKRLIGTFLQVRGLVHYHHSGNLGGAQSDMVLEKWLRTLYLDLQAAGIESHRACLGF